MGGFTWCHLCCSFVNSVDYCARIIEYMFSTVKSPMERLRDSAQTEIGRRLNEVIIRIWGSQKACAQETGISERSLSNYVQHERVPRGPEMVKLAEALPGWIDYILTGRRPTEFERREIGSLPEPLQKVVKATVDAPREVLHALEQCATILTEAEKDMQRRFIEEVDIHDQNLQLRRRALADLEQYFRTHP